MPAPLILVADDEALIRWSLKEHLEKAGYRVFEAGTGEQALQALDGEGGGRVALVLLDYKLPDQDGIEVLKAVRRAQSSCKVIMMSAYGTAETAAEAERLGVYRFLHKPFDYKEVVSLVGEALAASPSK